MTRRWIVLPVVGFGLIAGSVGSYAAWSDRPFAFSEESEDADVESAATQPTVEAYVRACALGHDAANQWLAEEIAYATRCNNLPRLLTLYDGREGPYRDNEDATWLTCRGLLMEGRMAEFEHLRSVWRGKEKRQAAWLTLDADALLLEGRQNEARTLLSSRSFEEAEDAGRLARLALVADDALAADALLTRAAALAPNELDVRLCRGRLFEAEGRSSAAAAEFAAALALRGNDWLLRDQLAECYRRAGGYQAACLTWMSNGEDSPEDIGWIKAWFWNRVVRPVSCDWGATAPDPGRMQKLAAYLVALPGDRFWSFDYRAGHGPPVPGQLRQETYWLHLLGMLQAGREREAAYLLRNAPFRRVSWQSDLENALDRVLAFRAGKPPSAPVEGGQPRLHPFFAQLELLASEGKLTPGAPGVPDDLLQLLGSEEALSATLLAAGWQEAAILLHHPDADLSRLPDWFKEGLTRALWTNHSASDALMLVQHQRRSGGIFDLLAGELLVAEGRGPEGLKCLRAAFADPGETGERAAWLFAVEAVREKRPAEARRALEDHPQLTNNTEGLTLLARCAAAEGNDEQAERLYRELAGESAEAREYLARRAIAGGDWQTAGRLLRETGH